MSQCPSQEVLKLAIEALENSIDLVSNDAREAELLYGKYQSRLAQVKGLVALEVAHGKAIAAIKEALAQPEQEPVAYDKTELNCFAQDLYDQKMREGKRGHYESMFHVIHQCIKKVAPPPPQRPWVGLTDDEKQAAYIIVDGWSNCVNFIEKTLRDKNT